MSDFTIDYTRLSSRWVLSQASSTEMTLHYVNVEHASEFDQAAMEANQILSSYLFLNTTLDNFQAVQRYYEMPSGEHYLMVILLSFDLSTFGPENRILRTIQLREMISKCLNEEPILRS